MNKKNVFLLLVSVFLLSLMIPSCTNPDKTDHFTIMFYNTENLYDTIDDPNKRDEEFLPAFKVPWNTERYQRKIKNIAKVIRAVDSASLPIIVGLAEVENEQVLEDLVNTNDLEDASYMRILGGGEDKRGIHVALLYRSDFFQPLFVKNYDATQKKNKDHPTRPILYVKGLLDQDSVHIFVNHWPSRWLGKGKTERARVHAAFVLKRATDSLFQCVQNPNIIIMGDFNDNPIDPSLLSYLNADLPETSRKNVRLYNMQMQDFYQGVGSLFYKQWDMFDQIIVSPSLLDSANNKLRIENNKGEVLRAQWLMYFDKSRKTWRPNRTKSRTYYGGYSDHLPVYIRLDVEE